MPAADFGPKVDKEVEQIGSSDDLIKKKKEPLFKYKRDMGGSATRKSSSLYVMSERSGKGWAKKLP